MHIDISDTFTHKCYTDYNFLPNRFNINTSPSENYQLYLTENLYWNHICI